MKENALNLDVQAAERKMREAEDVNAKLRDTIAKL